MQRVHIRPFESGTMIPLCGLDPATDKLRRLFKLSIGSFQASCIQETSPARWLYFLLSNQQFIIAKVHTLDAHIAETQEKCQQQSMRLTFQLQEESSRLSERERGLLEARVKNTSQLYAALETIAVSLKSPKEQLEKLKNLRLKKITRFGVRLEQLRRDLHAALMKANLPFVDASMVTQVFAYLFSFANMEMTKSLDTRYTEDVLKKIEAALSTLPIALQTTLLSIFSKPGLWERLKSTPKVHTALTLLPVLIAFFKEFDIFRIGHVGLISGLITLKNRVEHIEQCYTNTVINSKVDGVIDVDSQALYHATTMPNKRM